MTRRLHVFATFVILLALTLTVTRVQAAQDRTPPSTPKDFRVTAVSAYSVTFAWTPSTDNSGSVTYVICCANVSSETFPGPASTRVYHAGLQPGHSNTMRIVARDAAGNYSKYSNSVTFTTTRDTVAPTKPVVNVTDVGPTSISLSWSSIDESPSLYFGVTQNGTSVLSLSRNTSGTFGPLQPSTNYTFQVSVRDPSGNVGPSSDPVTVTTDPLDEADTTPPTMPGNLTDNGMSFPDGETWLFWQQSTDNVDPQSVIRYDVYLNGTLDHSLVGGGQTILYGLPDSLNTYTVIAVDSSGNESQPTSITTCAGAC